MFISFLMPFVDRGSGPLHHWVMLSQMAGFGIKNIGFIGSGEYFDRQAIPFGEPIEIASTVFTCPTAGEFDQFLKISLPNEMGRLLSERFTNDIDLMRSITQDPILELENYIEIALLNLLGEFEIEAILIWGNCRSVESVAERLRIPVIHNELGPLRAPVYRPTFYFDFRGVNGNTTPADWAENPVSSKKLHIPSPLSPDEIRGLLVIGSEIEQVRVDKQLFEIGVALQVEDDSNIICYSNEWDTPRLLSHVIRRTSEENILVRNHPGSKLKYEFGLGKRDDSISSVEFLTKIRKLITINSSVAVEASLLGIPFKVLGDTSAKILEKAQELSGRKRDQLFNAYFLAYLVPANFMFNVDYYRWRLAKERPLNELFDCHLAEHLALANQVLPTLASRGSELSMQPSERKRRLGSWTKAQNLKLKVDALRDQVADRENLLRALVINQQASTHEANSQLADELKALDHRLVEVIELLGLYPAKYSEKLVAQIDELRAIGETLVVRIDSAWHEEAQKLWKEREFIHKDLRASLTANFLELNQTVKAMQSTTDSHQSNLQAKLSDMQETLFLHSAEVLSPLIKRYDEVADLVTLLNKSLTKALQDAQDEINDANSATTRRLEEGVTSINESIQGTSNRLDSGFANSQERLEEGVRSINESIQATTTRLENGLALAQSALINASEKNHDQIFHNLEELALAVIKIEKAQNKLSEVQNDSTAAIVEMRKTVIHDSNVLAQKSQDELTNLIARMERLEQSRIELLAERETLKNSIRRILSRDLTVRERLLGKLERGILDS